MGCELRTMFPSPPPYSLQFPSKMMTFWGDDPRPPHSAMLTVHQGSAQGPDPQITRGVHRTPTHKSPGECTGPRPTNHQGSAQDPDPSKAAVISRHKF